MQYFSNISATEPFYSLGVYQPFPKTSFVENIGDAALGPFKLGIEGIRMAERTENRNYS